MSFGSDPSPFQQMGSARPRQPSIVPKIIAVVAALFVVAVLLIIVAVTVKSVGGGLAQGLYGNKENAKKITDVELWNQYNDDEEEAKKMYDGRWVVVTGKCSQVDSYRPDGSAINEQYAIQIGPREAKFGDVEWLVRCNIPRQNVEEFNRKVKENGIVSVRGKPVGRNRSNEIEMKECELVSFSIK